MKMLKVHDQTVDVKKPVLTASVSTPNWLCLNLCFDWVKQFTNPMPAVKTPLPRPNGAAKRVPQFRAQFRSRSMFAYRLK